MSEENQLAEVRRLRAEDPTIGNVKIGRALGISRQQAERLLNKLKLADAKASQSTALIVPEIEPTTPAEYAERITQCYRKSKEAVIEAGRWLIRAKDALPHGDFEAMVTNDLPFGPRHARRLMAIAGDERITNRTHVSVLPEAVGTLYELTKLNDDSFASRVADGTIRPDMERRDIAATVKRERRDNREHVLGGLIAAGNLRLPNKRYGVILADPEWKFETWSPAGLDRSADNHYATSETAKIAARPVADIAAKDCVLFLWATAPMLPHALHVMAAWGFEYKSHAIWDKGVAGTGYWFRNAHELILVGTHGNVVAPAMGTQPPSVFTAPRDAHSVKPDCVYEIIEQWFPHLPKIELNAREAREGWDRWGAEAPIIDPNTREVREAAE